MNVEILVVSHAKDFRYLRYALRSIRKFCTGFSGCTVVIPSDDYKSMRPMIDEWSSPMLLTVKTFEQWPGKGMLHHMFIEVSADTWGNDNGFYSDLITHVDSDCVFTDPVTPEDYMVYGKPVLCYASFDWLCEQQGNIRNWQIAVKDALGWTPENEFMRKHPAVHWSETYRKTREMIESHNAMTACDYIKGCKNEFPQTFAEYPTLGEIAWKFFHDKYHWINQQADGLPKSKLHQAWSHRPPTEEDMSIYEKAGLV